jgi:hypothetical protein
MWLVKQKGGYIEELMNDDKTSRFFRAAGENLLGGCRIFLTTSWMRLFPFWIRRQEVEQSQRGLGCEED